ncbi:MAG TPA: DNA polymerase III subunit beta [Phycisphaerae bacterium]|nr:DNA polymerase III subunit beta [Phycisphaerae bacterium]HNU45619.1 DNA polymerase III subunit beta [Phycisphaerae bacterium]
MKVRFNRHEMAEALTAISSVAAGRTPKPILQCVHIQAKSDAVLLCATDLELSVRCAVSQVEVDKTGEAVVVADTLTRIVRESGDEVLVMDLAKQVLHLRGQDSHFQMVTRDPADFPPVAGEVEEADFEVDFAVLRRLVDWTVFACARESTRYAINGVLWAIEGEQLVLVATDGRRLALARGAFLPKRAGVTLSVIVPQRALTLLSRVPVAPDTSVTVRATANQLVLAAGPVVIGTSLVEGHFPRYQDVIPIDNDKRVALRTGELQSALKRAALLTNEESRGVRMAFSQEGLVLSSRAAEQGEATIQVAVEYGGEPLDIGFNPLFLLDVLRVADAEEITLSFKEPSRPGVFNMGKDFTYVVMPINLS